MISSRKPRTSPNYPKHRSWWPTAPAMIPGRPSRCRKVPPWFPPLPLWAPWKATTLTYGSPGRTLEHGLRHHRGICQGSAQQEENIPEATEELAEQRKTLETWVNDFTKTHTDLTYAATEPVAYYLMADVGFKNATPRAIRSRRLPAANQHRRICRLSRRLLKTRARMY